MTRRAWVFLVSAILTFGLSAPAWAQPASAPPPTGLDLGIAYQRLHVPGDTSRIGLNLDLAVPFMAIWNVVVEVGFSHFGLPGGTGSSTVLHGAAGARVRRPLTRTSYAYLQGLAGVARSAGPGDTDSGFMLQPGAGVFLGGNRWGLFAEASLRPVFYAAGIDGQSRLLIGIRTRRQ